MAGLKGKTGIVTGGSSGIGFQIANVLAQAGATVYVISRTGKPKEGVGESAPGVVHLQGDIGNAEAMKTLVAELAAKHNDCLNFLVNNAGVSYKCRAEDFPMEQFDNIMNVNVKYLFQMSVICYPYLKKSADKGRIINITSMSAVSTKPDNTTPGRKTWVRLPVITPTTNWLWCRACKRTMTEKLRYSTNWPASTRIHPMPSMRFMRKAVRTCKAVTGTKPSLLSGSC